MLFTEMRVYVRIIVGIVPLQSTANTQSFLDRMNDLLLINLAPDKWDAIAFHCIHVGVVLSWPLSQPNIDRKTGQLDVKQYRGIE